jgi:hypothetical protein
MRAHRTISSIACLPLIALVSVACGAAPGVTTSASSLARPSASSGAGTAGVGGSPAGPSASSALPEGVYRTPSLTVDEIRAALTANGVSTSQFDIDYKGVRSIVFSLRFGDGRMSWFESRDGGPDEIDAEGTYSIEGGSTIVETDSQDRSMIRIDFSVVGTMLKTHWTVDRNAGSGDPHALTAIVAFFNTAAYTRQP